MEFQVDTLSVKEKNHKKILLGLVLLASIAVIGIIAFGGNEIEASGSSLAQLSAPSPTASPLLSPLSGQACENYKNRPIAVMLSSDPETRPLSAISEADIVFEMPVVDVGVTRMMAVFQCEESKKIGSIRSSRLDFIPLVMGLDAIYSHWGGEKEALEKLRAGTVDNIDGLLFDGTVYYRDSKKPRPHNGFTSYERLMEKAKEFGYPLDGGIVSYPHEDKSESLGDSSPPVIFSNPSFQVRWDYDSSMNRYARTRAGKAEVDRNTGKQVRVQNVVIMETTWTPIDQDYIRVKTVGSGKVTVYKNGVAVEGIWQKKNEDSKLEFLGEDGAEIPFVPGKIWIEIVTS